MKIWAVIALAVYIGACGLATSLPLGTVQRLDTSNVMKLEFKDSLLAEAALDIISAAHPLETSLCYTGFVKDTTYYVRESRTSQDTVEVTRQIVIISGVSKANVNETGPDFVNYHDDIACKPEPNLIGMAHSHPMTGMFDRCSQSDPDAIFHFRKQVKYMFSMVWCPYGLSVLWADGRRWEIPAVRRPDLRD